MICTQFKFYLLYLIPNILITTLLRIKNCINYNCCYYKTARRLLSKLNNYNTYWTGMFPYVCAAMIPVFCDPATMSKILRTAVENVWNDKSGQKSAVYKPPSLTKQNAITAGVCVYTALQLFLPYSHIVTQVSILLFTDCVTNGQTAWIPYNL